MMSAPLPNWLTEDEPLQRILLAANAKSTMITLSESTALVGDRANSLHVRLRELKMGDVVLSGALRLFPRGRALAEDLAESWEDGLMHDQYIDHAVLTVAKNTRPGQSLGPDEVAALAPEPLHGPRLTAAEAAEAMAELYDTRMVEGFAHWGGHALSGITRQGRRKLAGGDRVSVSNQVDNSRNFTIGTNHGNVALGHHNRQTIMNFTNEAVIQKLDEAIEQATDVPVDIRDDTIQHLAAVKDLVNSTDSDPAAISTAIKGIITSCVNFISHPAVQTLVATLSVTLQLVGT